MIFKNGNKLTPAIGSAGLLKIMMNGSQLWPEISKEIPLSETTAGDILLWDKTGLRKLFVSSDALSSYPSDSYTPIGIVVVPASHDVYGDGSCGVMSLKPMNCDTPSTGSSTSEQSMCWGVDGYDISALPNLNQAPYVDTGSSVGNASSTLVGQTDYPGLPSDKFSDVQCPHDTDAYYFVSSYQAPSPYLTDGSRNPAYYQTSSPSSPSNALADFDGIGNTAKIITQRGTKDYNSWTPGRTIEADYPAASCCDMFYTEGTSQGDWYLPACGELGYIMPPFNKINDAIDKMRTAYGSSVVMELNTGSYYWSSTEYSSNNARRVHTDSGVVYSFDKHYNSHVRAFLKVSPLDLSGISPESAPNGTYIYANNGKLYGKEEWDTANNEKALGVAVVTDNCKFVIDKKLPMVNNIQWSKQLSSTDVEGILTTKDEEIAQTDYAGKNNTDLIISNTENEDSSNNAAHYCTSQEMNGNKGYLPSSGELYKIWENKDVIDQTLILIGSKSIYDKAYEISNLPPYFWCSTEYRSDESWFLFLTKTSSPLVHEYKATKTSRFIAFPVFQLV